MTYSDPTHPSPEGEIIARSAAELFQNKKVDEYAIFVSTTIKGVRECDVLVTRLEQLGVPRSVLIVQPIADTTDGEFEAFAKYAHEHSLEDVAVLSIEAKKGRIELIAKRLKFFPAIYWAEDVLAISSNKNLQNLVAKWRKSIRHGMLRLRLGFAPMALMFIDPESKIQRSLAKLIRHQS